MPILKNSRAFTRTDHFTALRVQVQSLDIFIRRIFIVFADGRYAVIIVELEVKEANARRRSCQLIISLVRCIRLAILVGSFYTGEVSYLRERQLQSS